MKIEPAILRVLPAENRSVGSSARKSTRSPTWVPSMSVMRTVEPAGADPAQPVPPLTTCMASIADTSSVVVGANGTTARRAARTTEGVGEHMELDGKSVLITGGSRGIGLETARRFLSLGARVTIGGVQEEKGERATDVPDVGVRLAGFVDG